LLNTNQKLLALLIVGAQGGVQRVVYDCWLMAAKDSKIDDIKRLLKRGVKVDRTTEISGVNGLTALFCAAGGGRNEIVKILLESGADTDKETDHG